MEKKTFAFPATNVDYYFNGSIKELGTIAPSGQTFIITDDNIARHHLHKFNGLPTITIPAGEQHKQQSTVDHIIQNLIAAGADRSSFLIGVGGGVVTDITGYVASIFMRGISFGFVPTTLLAMVDASIGGKNGVDVGKYKNLVGIIRQPTFLLYDISFLETLPMKEWSNGFAEIIKHACIKDESMFRDLSSKNPLDYLNDPTVLADLVKRNALLKTAVVMADEQEKGDRKLLNFGHTLGHAIENDYRLDHGQAVSIGMMFAARISKNIFGFPEEEALGQLLACYGLPTKMTFDKQRAMSMLKMDKKKNKSEIHYILLEKIGKGLARTMPFEAIEEQLANYP